MTDFINNISSAWAHYFIYMSAHNFLFLSLILTLLYIFRKRSAAFLRWIALAGMIKLLLPPFINIPIYKETDLSGAGFAAGMKGESLPLLEGIPWEFSISSWGLFLWIAVSLILIFKAAQKTFRSRKISRNTEIIDVSKLTAAGMKSNVLFLRSNYEHSPLVFGFIRHKIVFPKSWNTWPDDCKRAIIEHELAHIRNRDHWIKLLQITAQAVNFFNPLTWILNRKLSYFSELSCDDIAIETVKLNPVRYSKFLVGVAEKISLPNNEYVTQASFSNSHRNLKKRINYQLEEKDMKSEKKLTIKNVVVIALAWALILPFSWHCTEEIIGNIDETEKNPAVETSVKQTESERPAFLPYEDQPKPIGGLKAIGKRIVYPEIARRAGIQGQVQIKAYVDVEGNVTRCEVLKSLGKNGCNEAAINAVMQTKFTPANQNGKPIPFHVVIPVVFKLENKSIDKLK